ncbi:MAG: type VI secretion system tip protein VgrG [Deltaproteobacteria bacterium]|nr:type VI secretion system tip protein VgrG [Deltaproteobacteria bacterium]
MTLHVELISGAFLTDAAAGPQIEVRGLDGREAVGELYEFRLLLQRDAPFAMPELDRLLAEPCALRLWDSEAGAVEPDSFIQGILRRVDRLDAGGRAGAFYYAELVPRAWLLETNRGSRAFMDQRLADIARALLGGCGLVDGTDYAIRLSAGHQRKLEYCVQFEETDWTFLQRRLEHEGYAYWFEQGDGGERLVIADHVGASASFEPPIEASYGLSNLATGSGYARQVLYDWTRSHRRTHRRVALIDYDSGQRRGKATAAAARWLMRQAEVAPVGSAGAGFPFGAFGSLVELGDYTGYATSDGDDGAGAYLARVRAEQVSSERVVYGACTQSRRLHAGSVFVLRGSTLAAGHPDENYEADEDNDRKYFVTAVQHRYGVPVRCSSSAFEATSSHYLLELTAVRADLPYRPPRRTPWPRIDGVLGAVVVGERGDGTDAQQKYPHIDEHGRYKVRLPFAVHGGSHVWVRMAETMTGQSYGTHLPLHPGAEVLLAHIAGNPDRPVIVGALPNGSMPTPVAQADAPRSRIRSAGQVTIEIDDSSPQ